MPAEQIVASQNHIIEFLGSGFLGSLITLIITKILDGKQEQRNKKLWIFRTLATNIQSRFNHDFVSAINLIPVDFHKDRKVVESWEHYRKTLNWNNAHPSEEEVKVHLKEIDQALASLIQSVGTNLGYKQDKLDILEKSYAPQLWQNDDLHIRKKEQMLMEIFEGKRSLNVNLNSSSAQNS